MSKHKKQKNRLEPTSLMPLSVEDALRGAMQVSPSDKAKPKKRKHRKATKKRKKAQKGKNKRKGAK